MCIKPVSRIEVGLDTQMSPSPHLLPGIVERKLQKGNVHYLRAFFGPFPQNDFRVRNVADL